MQILIFRIELDLSIESIPRTNPTPILNPMLPDFFRLEANRKTAKNEGLADDNTTITLLKLSCLRSMKSILEDFSGISGLICNYDKAVIMPINAVNEPML